MAELKILGARRVEALQEVIDKKIKERKAALKIPSKDDITLRVDAEFGLVDKRAEFNELYGRLKTLLSEINGITGDGEYISISSSYSRSRETPYRKRYDELERELRQSPLEALDRECADKKTQLWLCETLEQAKAIVGI